MRAHASCGRPLLHKASRIGACLQFHSPKTIYGCVFIIYASWYGRNWWKKTYQRKCAHKSLIYDGAESLLWSKADIIWPLPPFSNNNALRSSVVIYDKLEVNERVFSSFGWAHIGRGESRRRECNIRNDNIGKVVINLIYYLLYYYVLWRMNYFKVI